MTSFNENLTKYAELAVKVGVNKSRRTFFIVNPHLLRIIYTFTFS